MFSHRKTKHPAYSDDLSAEQSVVYMEIDGESAEVCDPQSSDSDPENDDYEGFQEFLGVYIPPVPLSVKTDCTNYPSTSNPSRSLETAESDKEIREAAEVQELEPEHESHTL